MTDRWTTYSKAYGRRSPGRLVVRKSFGTRPGRKGRDLVAWLPPSATFRGGPYPILYLLDGQNLFDEETSYASSWGIPATLENLADQGLEMVVVGLPHAGRGRLREYSPRISKKTRRPLKHPFLDFLVQEVLPEVEGRFAVDPERRFIGGSSMGGLFSLYSFFAKPETFRGVMAMSPSLRIGGRNFRRFVHQASTPPGRIYLDTGTEEVSEPRPDFDSEGFMQYVIELAAQLQEKGYSQGEHLRLVVDSGAAHGEQAWARRLPEAIRFLVNE